MNGDYIGENGMQDVRSRLPKRRGQATLNAQGRATLVFNPPITMAREPYIQLTPRVATGANPVICNLVVGSFTMVNGAYTGVTIKGARLADKLPTLTPVSGLISAVITGVNAIVSALSGFKLLDDGAANGVVVDWLAT